MDRSMEQHAAADEPPSPIDLAIDTDAPPIARLGDA